MGKPTNYAWDIQDLQTEKLNVEAWIQWVPNAFPGLSVKTQDRVQPTTGLVQITQIGPARLFSIIQSSQTLLNDPTDIASSEKTCGLVYQKKGRSEFRYSDRAIQLREGDMILTDGGYNFEIESLGITHTYVITFPRHFANERAPKFFRKSGHLIPANTPLLPYLVSILERSLNTGSNLIGRQRAGLIEAIFSLIEALPFEETSEKSQISWRVRKALKLIEAAPTNPEINANYIAKNQNISRRRLDQIFLDEIGSTISYQISEKRLTHAAATLCEPELEALSITEIAFSSGFSDSAHFSRAFKLRFKVTPRQWRNS